MARTVIWATFAILAIAGCRSHRRNPLDPPVSVGTLAATQAVVVEAGVSDVRVFIRDPGGIVQSPLGTRDVRDSVEYSFETNPPKCAEADVRPGYLGIGHRDRHCATRWTIRIPPRVAEVQVRVSVGDIELSGPNDRAIRLHSGVGSVRLSIDGRRLEHSKSPGAGDELRLGDRRSLPRVDASTGVGSVHAELTTDSKPKDSQLR